MQVAVVNCRAIDSQYSPNDIAEAVSLLNVFINFMYDGKVKKGLRNDYAVNFACLCHVAELNPNYIINTVLDASINDGVISTEDGLAIEDDLINRIHRRNHSIDSYLEAWDFYTVNGVWDKMIDVYDDKWKSDSKFVWVDIINVAR